MKHLFKLFIICVILFGCKKENKNTQWDIALLAPLFKASISVDHLLADSLKNTAPDGAVTLVYSKSIYSIPVDSVFKIQDTTIFLNSTLFADAKFPPSFSIPVSIKPIVLTLSGAELKRAVIKKGYLRMTAKNHLAGRVVYSFSIGKATLNGDSMSITKTVAAGTNTTPTVFDTLIDMTGYDVNMTGNGSEFNKIIYNVTAVSVDSINYHQKDTLYNVAVNFIDLVPVYATGYLGQNSTTASGSKYVSVSKLIKNGTLLLDSVQMKVTFQDSVGADAQAFLTSMRSVNTKTSTTVNLTGTSVINRAVNLSRAIEKGPYPSGIMPSFSSFTIDETNSNLLSFIQNIPDSIGYDVNFSINPLGNISGHHDFIYTDSLFNATLDLRFPLRFAANQLTFVDTQSISIANKTDFDAVGAGVFTLIADNGFPWEFDLHVDVLDEGNNIVDVVLVPGTIAAAAMNAYYRATSKQRSKIIIPVDERRKNLILNAPRIVIRASLSTSAYPQVLQIYSDYSLDLKLIADAKYLIR